MARGRASPVQRAIETTDFNGLRGEPAGDRTRDPVIKSHVLYRLSYGLAVRVCTGGPVAGQ